MTLSLISTQRLLYFSNNSNTVLQQEWMGRAPGEIVDHFNYCPYIKNKIQINNGMVGVEEAANKSNSPYHSPPPSLPLSVPLTHLPLFLPPMHHISPGHSKFPPSYHVRMGETYPELSSIHEKK